MNIKLKPETFLLELFDKEVEKNIWNFIIVYAHCGKSILCTKNGKILVSTTEEWMEKHAEIAK